ncbi:MAG: acyl carrier protein [Crocinitomicaceae bacterium]|nr:acyl carrier protein [Crocinitomicaceae bacterium]
MNSKLVKLLSDVFEMKEIEITIDLVKDDIDSWDSLKQMDLVLSIENNYDITLEMEEIVKMSSVKSIVEIIESKNLG